jgi:hypothetical protein
MTHRFSINGKTIADGTSKGVVRSKQGIIPPAVVIAAVLAFKGNGLSRKRK